MKTKNTLLEPIFDSEIIKEAKTITLEPKIEKKGSEDGFLNLPERLELLSEIKELNPAYLGHFKKAFAGKSLKAVVTAKCLECACFQKAEIRNCPVTQCPLWEVRPYVG